MKRSIFIISCVLLTNILFNKSIQSQNDNYNKIINVLYKARDKVSDNKPSSIKQAVDDITEVKSLLEKEKYSRILTSEEIELDSILGFTLERLDEVGDSNLSGEIIDYAISDAVTVHINYLFSVRSKKYYPAGLEIYYGISHISSNNINSSFNNNGFFKINIIYQEKAFLKEYQSGRLLRTGIFYSISKDKYISNSDINSKISSDLNQFGLDGLTPCIGFGNSEIQIYPYSTAIITPVWSKFKMNSNSSQFSTEDIIKINDFNNTWRYGNVRKGGILLDIKNKININICFERIFIFSRHLILQDYISSAIEDSPSILFYAINEIYFVKSPVLGSILNFIVGNTVAYGLSQLRKEKMNWPFNSAPPLCYDSFKFGVGVHF